jgi:hypothetical protein
VNALRSRYWLAVAALLVLTAAVGVRNAFTYPAIAGFDAADNIDYAETVVHELALPTENRSYYTPPVFFVLAGASMELADALGFDEPAQGAQLLNAAIMVAAALLTLALARLVAPGRPLVHLVALAFFVACPLVPRLSAMVHPQPLAMFFSTLALVLTARMIVRRRFRIWEAVAVAAALDFALLVRNVTFATALVVLVVLGATAAARPDLRRPALVALAVVATLTIAIPAPWYVHLQRSYGNAIFGRGGSDKPLTERYPASFYVSPALPQIITAPQRNGLGAHFLPILYADTWGDFFGVWEWGYPPHDLTEGVNDRLEAQSIVGLVPTTLAVAGWIALLGTALARLREHPERLLVGLMPLAVLAAALFYALRSPTTDVDTVKGLFLLSAVPAWGIGLGFGVDVLHNRSPRFAAAAGAVLVVCGLVSLGFGVR